MLCSFVTDIKCYNFFLKVLEEIKVQKKMDRDTLINVARTSLRTKLHPELADLLTEVLKKSFFLTFPSVTAEANKICKRDGFQVNAKSHFLVGVFEAKVAN